MSDDATAQFNAAVRLRAEGRLLDALAAYDRVLKFDPAQAAALNNRGNILLELGRSEEALASFDRAIALKPEYARAHNNRGNALKALGRLDDALASYARAIEREPGHAQAFNNRGSVLAVLGRPDEALASYDKGIALNPGFAGAHSNRGDLLLSLGRPEESLTACERALALDAGHIGALVNRGNALMELGRSEEALESYSRAVALAPGHHDALKNRGLCELLLGRFSEGWRDYEHRWESIGFPTKRPPIDAPAWRGEDLNGAHILVYCEQGAGDIIQFARYLPLLAQRGAKTTVLGSAKLRLLLGGLASEGWIGSETELKHAPDFQCALMSLPLHFGTDLSSIPNAVPYVRAEPKRIVQWKEKLGAHGFKIGIAWQGKPGGRLDQGRSIPLAEFAALARIPGARMISLQKHFGLEQLAALPAGTMETPGEDFDAGPDAFVDTAAIMDSLDLVVSSDTSIAHLAGAMARPVWVALKFAPDWRWLQNRSGSPWYPTMRLFRQKMRGDWTAVFTEMSEALASLARGKRPM